MTKILHLKSFCNHYSIKAHIVLQIGPSYYVRVKIFKWKPTFPCILKYLCVRRCIVRAKKLYLFTMTQTGTTFYSHGEPYKNIIIYVKHCFQNLPDNIRIRNIPYFLNCSHHFVNILIVSCFLMNSGRCPSMK